MTIEHWSLFLLAAIGLSLTPGPNGLLTLSHGMRFGVGPTVMVALGGIFGFLVLIAASLSGLGALLAASERAFQAVKWIGAAYLIYLGRKHPQLAGPTKRPANRCRQASENT